MGLGLTKTITVNVHAATAENKADDVHTFFGLPTPSQHESDEIRFGKLRFHSASDFRRSVARLQLHIDSGEIQATTAKRVVSGLIAGDPTFTGKGELKPTRPFDELITPTKVDPDGTHHFGAIRLQADHVSEFVGAQKHLVASVGPEAQAIFERLHARSKPLHVNASHDTQHYVLGDDAGDSLSWNPRLGNVQPGRPAASVSPALALLHEQSHALLPHSERRVLASLEHPKYHNFEEKRAERYEKRASRNLGGEFRGNHGGHSILTSGSSSIGAHFPAVYNGKAVSLRAGDSFEGRVVSVEAGDSIVDPPKSITVESSKPPTINGLEQPSVPKHQITLQQQHIKLGLYRRIDNLRGSELLPSKALEAEPGDHLAVSFAKDTGVGSFRYDVGLDDDDASSDAEDA